ncbi:MAG: histidine ammonia-lyase [Candidatus Krumholzibacteriia bacterium]
MNTIPTKYVIGDDSLDLDLFARICRAEVTVELGDGARQRIAKCDDFRQELIKSGERIYGVNTGFGKLADTVIPQSDLALLQVNLIRSHAVGWGTTLNFEEARSLIMLRAQSLSHGFSGARVAVVEQLLWLLEKKLHPWIPSRGSVGASGDLAPLSHLALVLMGEGHFIDADGERVEAAPVLKQLGREPLVLEAKEGLALINGTQLMNGLGLLGVHRAQRLVQRAVLAATLSLEALEGGAKPFGETYHSIRPHPEIQAVAASFRALLKDSAILSGHQDCTRVQDPYSVRCSPQVLGATLGVVRQVGRVMLRESGSVTDNPVLFPDEGKVVTGGHFHGQPLAFQLDFLYQAVCELANIAERRINLLLSGNNGRLPRFLADQPGLESGLMIAQFLAAALVTENKSKAFPAAIDSVPTSDNQEDHVSMGSISALKLEGVLSRVEAVVSLELITAARAIQYISEPALAARAGREPLKLSPAMQDLLQELDQLADLSPGDRPLTDDLSAVSDWVRHGSLPAATRDCLSPLYWDGAKWGDVL